MYSSKSVEYSESSIDYGVQTAGSSNGIGCSGGLIDSPSLDRMIRSKLSCFNDYAALQC